MPLISDTTKSDFTSQVQDLFDCLKKSIVIHKEPIKTITNINADTLPGYGDESNQTNISYTPVSGVFYARVRYDSPTVQHQDDPVREIGFRIPRGGGIIECESDCKDFILNGKTERIDVDGLSFNVVSSQGLHDYLGLIFYYFTLENTT